MEFASHNWEFKPNFSVLSNALKIVPSSQIKPLLTAQLTEDTASQWMNTNQAGDEIVGIYLLPSLPICTPFPFGQC